MTPIEMRDCAKIKKLEQLTNPRTFWKDVQKLTKRVTSDHGLHRWQCLAEQRYTEITEEKRGKTYEMRIQFK